MASRFRITRILLVILGGMFCNSFLHAQYPPISTLELSDSLFAEQQESVRVFYRQSSTGGELPELTIYSYRTTLEDTLFGIAARISVPYSAVATLNRMNGTDLGSAGRQLLLPSIPGIFVPLVPGTDLEVIMHDLRHEQQAQVVTVTNDSTTTVFRFYPGEDFLSEERSTFLGLLFRAPLRVMTVSSPFGPRNHPVTGVWGFHAGVDLPAPRGTPVMAARSGVVVETGHDATMGNYVLLDHSGGFTTFYAHLNTVAVSLMDSVRSGMIIGTVGNTGITTGSHLHFEIRQDNDPRDPMKLLP
jgi:murein DD-endopeptidase MepM/ murein hydrolase activator NlpD